MKNRLLKIALTIIAFFQSASYVIAQNYSGRHYSDDEGGGLSLPTGLVIFFGIVIAVLGIFLSGGKLKDEKDGSTFGCFCYVALAAMIFFVIKACS